MNRQGAVWVSLTLAVLAGLLASNTQAAVHRIDVVHQWVPHLPPSTHQPKPKSITDTTTTINETVSGQVIYGLKMLLLGNVSLGTPAQTFSLNFDPSTPNLYVVGVNAQYYNPFLDPPYWNVTDRRLFNSSASSTFSSNAHARFTPIDYNYLEGSVGSDVPQLANSGSLPTVNVEVASELDGFNAVNLGYDGTFGLGSTPDPHTGTTLLGQLQSSLDSPVVTLRLNTTGTGPEGAGTGQIILGGLAPDVCQSNWISVDTDSGTADFYYLPIFNITGMSTTVPGDNSGCDYRHDMPMTVSLYPDFGIHTSYQVLEVFVQASNAKYNSKTNHYELTAEMVANASPVYLHLASSGNSIRMDPLDYIATDNNVHYLPFNADYDQRANTEGQENLLMLTTNFLNNHCLSKNIQTGVWSLANTIKDVEVVKPESPEDYKWV